MYNGWLIMFFLRRLRDLREDNDLNQTVLAELLKITRQQYSLYETGKREIPARYLQTLAKYYHTSTDYILELTDDTKPSTPPYKKNLSA